jgi:hypothetical protein
MGMVFFVVYICALIGVGLYVLGLMSRAVKAHERAAGALERIAHNMKSGAP